MSGSAEVAEEDDQLAPHRGAVGDWRRDQTIRAMILTAQTFAPYR